ncbi:LytTR family DNA-binding domain-containing protein [soil metagenome]
MKVLIIEDEQISAHLLEDILSESYAEIQILAKLHSVSGAVEWLRKNEEPDLIFMDIQLPDGLGFDVFRQVEISTPVIFISAFDQYALKAFKVNSLDYLLKPIDIEELHKAVKKYKAWHGNKVKLDNAVIENLIRSLSKPTYKERFMVKTGQNLNFVQTNDILYAYAEDGLVFIVMQDGKKHHIDHKIEELQSMLNPTDFFRVNRKFIVRISAIHKISTWFNSRLKLDVQHGLDHEIIVSRERVSDFKDWLGQ